VFSVDNYAVPQHAEGGRVKKIIGFLPSVLIIITISFAQASDTLWTKTYGGTEDDYGYLVQQTSDSGYIIVGETHSFGAGGSDIWLLRILPRPGIEDKESKYVNSGNFGVTIISGPLLLPEGKQCRVFDITGRVVEPGKIRPGIYFVEIDGKMVQKVIKIK